MDDITVIITFDKEAEDGRLSGYENRYGEEMRTG